MLEEGAAEAGARGAAQLRHNLDSLNAMVDFASDEGTCRRVLLMRHFGEQFDPGLCAGALPRNRTCLCDVVQKLLGSGYIYRYNTRPAEHVQFKEITGQLLIESAIIHCLHHRSLDMFAGTCDNCAQRRGGGGAERTDVDARGLAKTVVTAVRDLNARDVAADLAAAKAYIFVRSAAMLLL